MSARCFSFPPLITRLRQIAPRIRINVEQTPREFYRDALESGTADLAIGQLPRGQTDFLQQVLSQQPFFGYARADHPILENPTLEAFLAADHLVIGPPATAEVHLRKALGPLAAKRRITLQLRHYLSVPYVLAATDLIAVLPHTIRAANPYGALGEFIPRSSSNRSPCASSGIRARTRIPAVSGLRSQIADLFIERTPAPSRTRGAA